MLPNMIHQFFIYNHFLINNCMITFSFYAIMKSIVLISMEIALTLLTSITSKMVRLHLLYALLIYFLVILGSMGTGEDLFYKCCAPSEEIVHSLRIVSRSFSMKPIKFVMRLSFLIITFLNTL